MARHCAFKDCGNGDYALMEENAFKVSDTI